MDDQTPTPPVPTTPEAGEEKPVVPDAHAGEPVPARQEGLRPEADPSVVRPEQDEPNGPLTGLVATAAAEVEAELTGDSDAEALLASMGVEDEGVEAFQIGSIATATLVTIFALALAMYYLFYVPFRDQTAGLAESDVRYEELEVVQAEGRTKLSQYALSADSAYTLPIESAMSAVAAEYADAGGIEMPRTRAGFNTAVLPASGSTLDAAAVSAADTSAVDSAPVLGDADVPGDEDVDPDTPPDAE